MTPNDKQIDLLMRRHARAAEPEVAGEHLDADEMNTFAEGALPIAARARYVSHLASCAECRQQVAQLAISSGVAVRTEIGEARSRRSFWEGLGALFSPRVLGYAAFAAVLLTVAGIAFIALRRPHSANELVASRTESEQHPASAIQPPAGPANGAATEANTRPQQSNSPTTTAPGSAKSQAGDVDEFAETAPSPTTMKEAPTAPAVETKKAVGESDAAKSQPSYAAPPPGETGQPASVGGVAAKREPQKADQASDTLAARAGERERTTGFSMNQSRDDRALKDQSVAQQRKATDEKSKGGPSRNVENRSAGSANENRVESTPLSIPAPKPNDTEEGQTRSAGGRKFRKQGSAWVDQKFKSSMTLKSVARGSDEFNSLDSGLRSIAQQLGGEVIVVWKGKAYLIK